jgi:cystathionine beta-lyase family protein involved in aluminum resistance
MIILEFLESEFLMTSRQPLQLIAQAEKDLADCFFRVDEIALANQKKVLEAFRRHKLTTEFFSERTGYALDDAARQVIDEIFAEVSNAEASAVRMQMVSGTHAIACALFGNLKAGDCLTCLTGHPYDTLEKLIGLSGNEPGSLKDMGVGYREADLIPLLADESALSTELAKLLPGTRLVFIQKSRGYSMKRPSLSNSEIACFTKVIRQLAPEVIVMVDNCYGELVEPQEPPAFGADLIAGSFIKNPGAGLTAGGGYFAGRRPYVEAALNRLTAPGIGGHVGPNFNQNRLLLQGLFLAPQAVANAVKGAQLFAHVFRELGFEVSPLPGEPRSDIIQAIKFGDRQKLIGFLTALQHFSPVDSHLKPEPADMPGYEDQIIMAGGTFVQGATIELSGDGPLRPPYIAYVQGGLTYMHVKLALMGILELSAGGQYQFL